MPEQIYKLSPNRDLQCYFLTPSAVAAMSQATNSGFVVSGMWRQQFDWAVVEWNRDNVFEHPALRYLPDGDLSGLTLSYQEQRSGCIPFESNLFPVVDWNNVRIWAPNIEGLPNTSGVSETVYHVDLAVLPGNESPNNPSHITPVGNYTPAQATMTVNTTPGTAGDRVGLAFLEEHYYYTFQGGEDLATIAAGLAEIINDPSIGSQTFSASSNGPSITVIWNPRSTSSTIPYQSLFGANANRTGMYGFCSTSTQVWQEPSAIFSGGQFPSTYQVTLNFGALSGYYYYYDDAGNQQTYPVTQIPTSQARKVRWTWAADLQPGTFEQTEFQATISNWTVTGNNRQYSVAGPGSRRIEDTDSGVQYTGVWSQPRTPGLDSTLWPLQTGNFSGSKIHFTQTNSDSCSVSYTETAQHQLYLGTCLISPGASITVSVDGSDQSFSLNLPGENVLARLPLGTFQAGTHSIVLTNNTDSAYLFFDFLEIAYPSSDLPDFDPQAQLALATDWDTYHSQSLPAERTAWLINKLGFQGRVNHYTGALWFYEIVRTGTQYASASIAITIGQSAGSSIAELQIGETTIQHLILYDDTSDTLAQAFSLLINNGSNSVWTTVSGNQLTITARAMGIAGNSIAIGAPAGSQGYSMTPSAVTLSGGIDGTPYDLDANDPLNSTLMAAADYWRTDLAASPRMNRAARDWHLAYFVALKEYGIDVVASFSTELMNGDPSETAGIAQRYPDATPVVLNTPSIQTNFSATAIAFWTQVYVDMAKLQNSAGLTPYLQFGEVQWWYYPKANSGMPFYDDYTTQQFEAKFGVPMQIIATNDSDPSGFPNEMTFLPGLIGAYTAIIRTAVQTQFPSCRFEVLYPTDTNDTPLDQLVNYPDADWTPGNLNCLKTESFTYTGAYNLDLSSTSMSVSSAKGFSNGQRSHLVGISDAWTAWIKEVDLAQSQGMESVVLFALDQYCLVGYPAPPLLKVVRSQRQG